MDLILRANWETMEGMRSMCQALDELMAEKYREKEEIGEKRGLALGMQQGIKQGEQAKLLSMVKKKLTKGISIAEIADALEEEIGVIQALVEEMKWTVQV